MTQLVDALRSTDLAGLRSTFHGTVITPGEPGYNEARQSFYGKYDRRPGLVIQPADAADVSRALALARAEGLALAIRSGGHSVAGHSAIEGGLLLDLARLRSLEIDPAGRTAWAGAGLTAGEYTTAAAEHGLATGFGDTPTVGLGGLTLGGGLGFLVRQHGLTIDDVLAAEIVTADGAVRRVDAAHEPDLFWALRGGGGNFGVVTRFQYRLHPVDEVVGGMLILPATPEVVAGFVAAAEAAPEALSTIANIMLAPPMPFVAAELVGQPVIFATLCYAGDAAPGERALAPFRALAAPLADMVRPMRYPELYTLFPPGKHGEVVEESARSTFMDAVDRDLAATILDHLRAATAPMAVAQLRVLGGALARVPTEATAFAHRQRRLLAVVGAVYDRAEQRAEQDAWADGVLADLRQGEPGVYVNFLTHEPPERLREAYPGRTWQRLVAVKQQYDPENLFRGNHNIPPA